MNSLLKMFGVFSLTLGLAACGSSSSSPLQTPTPDPDPDPTPAGTIVEVATAAGNFDTLVAALEATDLDEVLNDPDGSFTVFAPTDDAFALLGEEAINDLLADPEALSNILLYHVIVDAEIDSGAAVSAAGSTVEMANGQSVGLSLSGDDLLVNLSMVTTVDIMTDNGIIHVIDVVLIPPAERGEPTMNIAEIALETEELSTLVDALVQADLVDALADDEGTFTVFAPTNAAFEAVGEDLLNVILADDELLSSLLLQHVISGTEVSSVGAYAANGTSVETMSGAEVAVSITGSGTERVLRIGGALVTVADVYATNGVVHIIDAVIVGDLELPEDVFGSLTSVAAGNDDFSTLVAALETTGLDAVLADLSNEFTVFAPTNAAFDALEEGQLEYLLENPEVLENVLLYHAVSGTVLADSATSIATSSDNIVEMANGDSAALSLVGGDLFVNLSTVTSANVMADNGVIHVIDKVMMPPAADDDRDLTIAEIAADNEDFSTLVAALDAADLVGTFADEEGEFTVFAPTNAAFAAIDEDVLNAILADDELLAALLGQHVLDDEVNSIGAFAANGTSVTTLSGAEIEVSISNGSLQVGGATVSTFDIYASNGVIHVIDAVIVGDLELPEPAAENGEMTLAELVESDENFSTLLFALQETGLLGALDGDDAELTVFAPTNDAFDALEEGVLDDLLANPEALENVLLYHVFGGDVRADEAVSIAGSSGNVIEMLNEDNAALSLTGEQLYINLSAVITPDLVASNGVAHAINKVMIPPAESEEPTMNIVETAIDAGIFDTLVDAVTNADLAGALSDESQTYTVFAPTDDAFADLPEGALDDLTSEELAQILLNHVISGAAVDSVTAFSLNGSSAETMADNGSVSIEIVNGELLVGGAKVIMFDIQTTNGIIHVIESVILD